MTSLTFEASLEAFQKFRIKYLPILLAPLPSDPAAQYAERDLIEPWGLEAAEHAADLEAFELLQSVAEYEKPDSRSWEFCQAKAHEAKKWRKKAEAAAKAIESRSIKISQSLKLGKP